VFLKRIGSRYAIVGLFIILFAVIGVIAYGTHRNYQDNQNYQNYQNYVAFQTGFANNSRVPTQTLRGYISAGSALQARLTFTSNAACDSFKCAASSTPIVYVVYVQPGVNIDLSRYVSRYIELTGVIGRDADGNLMIMISQPPTIIA
jgi:hypothetical protein